jgi:predicted outer membrane repeat protein
MQSNNFIPGEKINQNHFSDNYSKFLLFALLIIGFIAVSETRAATITVDRTDDTAAAAACTAAANDCSLRGAFAFANANSGTVITIPAGTYNLSVDELQVGTATNILTTINGAGPALTTINQTAANRRVIDLNPTLSPNVVVNISGVRITGGNSPSDNFGGGGLIGGGAGNTLNLSNCTFENNSDVNAMTAKGGGIEWAGGGFLNIDNCTFNNNTAGSGAANKGVGGGVDYQLLNLAGEAGKGGLTITNSTFTNNKAGAQNAGAGGGLALAVTTTQTPRTVTITNNVFTGNQANASSNGHGGAVTSSSANPITLKFNRIIGNTATGQATGVYQSLGTNGTFDATQNWWGCNGGPGSAGCSTTGGLTASITTNPRIVLSHTPAASPIVIGQSTGLTASFLRDSANNVLTTANISRLIGLPIAFNTPVRGTLSGAQAAIQANGMATANFNSNAAGAGSANAVVDGHAATAAITINKGDTAITMNSSSPNPTVTGQSYTATFNLPTIVAPASGTLTGTVTVSDGQTSCTATLPATSCSLTSQTGSRNLTATYNGDANFNASPASTPIVQTINPAGTTATVTAHTPNPSVFGQSYTVSANVAVNAPGAGTPTGTINVTDGTNNCSIILPATGCLLPGNAVGVKTLTAAYSGDPNFSASPVSAGVSHAVNQALTTTTITSTSPNPSGAGQNVVVNYSVAVNAPGAGTPTGNVTVSDGTNSCVGTAAAGQCTLILPTAGNYILTATYDGDPNFTGSVSATFAHQVCAGSSSIVSNIADSGAGSLRQALSDVCSGGTITFSADFNTPQVITLTGEIPINKDVTITGAGANLVTINANSTGRVFLITGGTVNLSGLTITGGNAPNGGAIANLGGNLTITDSVVSGNTAANLGGGIYATGPTTISGSTISGNTANNPAGITGGGIHNTGSLTLINSTVSGNSVPNGNQNGGGIRSEGPTSIVNSTVTNNSAAGAASAGGLFRSAGTVTATNSLIAANQNNATVPDTAGAFDPASAYNLIGNVGAATGFAAANQNQTGTGTSVLNPLLGALGNNGGKTPTHTLLAGSPAIDKGTAAVVPLAENTLPPLTADQRGMPRPFDNPSIPNAPGGDGSDIGAVELQAPTAANVSLAGRVLDGSGNPVRNALVSMTDPNGGVRTVKTNLLGDFRFEAVEVGQTWTLQVSAKGLTFDPLVLTVNEEITDLILTPR